MSIVADQVRRVDSQLDRLQLTIVKSTPSSPVQFSTNISGRRRQDTKSTSSSRAADLQSIVKALSTTTSSNPLLSSWRLRRLLDQATDVMGAVAAQDEEGSAHESDLEWLLIGKATVQTYGLILNTLLAQTIPLSNDIWYWDDVLGSYTYTALYTIQTSPLRLWGWTRDVYQEAHTRFTHLRESSGEVASTQQTRTSFSTQWREFYALIQQSIQERSVIDLQRRMLSPIALCRSEARRKQAGLRRLREMSASGLGVLMDEGLSFDIEDDVEGQVRRKSQDQHEWRGVVEKSVALMDTILQNVTVLETGTSEFEDAVFASVHDDPELSSADIGSNVTRPTALSKRLRHVLDIHLPEYVTNSQRLSARYGRPSRLVRYWLPATALLLSSTTILRVIANRRAEILTWIRDLGSTIRDFWLNWVIDPTKKVIGTIRHDKDSEVAIMSKESLRGDRDSLERMVVDFAVDHPVTAGVGGGPLSDAQISEIRLRVKEGDLTPVLRAYEKDLRSPFMGTVRGDLVRTLLIQVQKTKVDVEVAISGIDALLKSQELVFGFIGLTPGILVSIATFRYLGGVFGNRRGLRQGRKAGQTIRVLRNVDRILTTSTPSSNGMLSYKDHGLLLCEVDVLRQRSQRLFPGEVAREFLEDVGELTDIRIGVERQQKVLQRIRWAYGKWLSH